MQYAAEVWEENGAVGLPCRRERGCFGVWPIAPFSTLSLWSGRGEETSRQDQDYARGKGTFVAWTVHCKVQLQKLLRQRAGRNFKQKCRSRHPAQSTAAVHCQERNFVALWVLHLLCEHFQWVSAAAMLRFVQTYCNCDLYILIMSEDPQFACKNLGETNISGLGQLQMKG